MALSFDEFRKRLLDTAQKNDEERAAITARVSETASQYEPVRPAQVKDTTPAMENRYQNQQMNPISFSQPKFPSRNGRGSQGNTDGETLLGKATGQGSAGSDSTDKQMQLLQKKIDTLWNQMEGYRNNGQTEKLPAAEQEWAALNQQLEQLRGQDRGNGFAHGGGFSSTGERREAERPWYDSVIDTVNWGSGQAVLPVVRTGKAMINAIPTVEGAIFGEEPEATFTGQLLKPLMDAADQAVSYAEGETEGSVARVAEDTKDSPIAWKAAELGAGLTSMLPRVVLSFLSGGTSEAGTLAAQGTGLVDTVKNAATTLLKHPMFAYSFAQGMGDGYDSAKEQGASDLEATTVGTITGIISAAMDASGGLENLPGSLRELAKTPKEQLIELGKSVGQEALEEPIQNALTELTNMAVFDRDKPVFSKTDEHAVINPARMGQEALNAAIMSSILGGGQMLGNSIANRAAKKITVDDVMPKLNGDDGLPRAQSALAMTEETGSTAPRNDSAVGGEEAVARAVEMMANENAPAQQAGAEIATTKPRISMEDFTNPKSEVFNNLEYGDTDTQQQIMQQTHAEMVRDGRVVQIPEKTTDRTAEYYPDLRSMKKKERTPILKQKITELKTELRKFLNSLKGANYEFEVNGNILDAKLYDTGVQEVMEKITQDKADMLFHSDEIFKNAQYLYSTPDYDDDSNVYRWNYFYTPVQIGNQTVGVRIAVRDMATPQESQIYNWNIKKNATLGGEGRGESRIPNDASSVASESSINTNVPNVKQEITVDDVMPKVGDMGAKTSDFPHEVKESKGKTLPDYYERNNIPEEGRADNHYTAVTEAESLHNAKLRLEQDYNGEVEELSSKADWNNEDMDMSYMVLDDLRAEAEKTGDWDSFKQWAKLDQDRGGDAARALQSRAKRNRNSATGILAAAADILDTAGDQVDADAVLGHISDLANRYDFANQTGDVDVLVQVIRDTASERNTGFKQTKKGQKQSKYLNWALDRIAGYAKSGALTGNADADVDITAANITDADTAYRFLQDFAYTGMLNVAADQNKASVGSKIMAIRRLALLSKTSTVMRNLVANGAFDVVDTLARDISVPLDMLFSKITGTRSVSADAGILSKAKRRGMLDGLAMASLETSLDVNGRNIKGKYVPNGTRTFKMSGNIVDRFFSTLEAVSGYALNVTDEMSKGGTAAEVQRGLDKLYSKGKIKATDDSLRAGGQQEALYRTFQDETVLSNVTKGIRKGLNEAHLGDVGLGDTMMPFAQVPANLVDRSIDYSPAGLAKTGGKLVDALIKAKKGEFTAAKQAQVVQSLGRNITGTGLIALATCCALKGLIRVVNPGGDDENKDKSAFEKMQGQSGTQWNLSATLRAMRGESAEWQDDDVLMSIAFLEPFNANMTIGALLAEDLQLEDSVTAKTIMKDSFSGSLASLLDMPMFDTFGDIVDAYTYSDKSRTGDKVLDAGKTLVANEIASLIPNAVKGIAQGVDEYQRDLYTKDDTWGQLGDQFRAVFDRKSLPIKQDSFGNDMTNDGKVLNALNNNILPGWISTYDTDDLMNEISRVARESGSDSVYPTRKAPDKLTIDSVDYPLDQKQQTQYQKTYGQAERDSRSALMENDTYGNFSVDQQAIAHRYAETYSKQVASNAINSSYELSEWVEDVKDKSPEKIAEAVIQRTVESLAKKQGTDKYDGLGDMLESGQIEDKVAIACLPPSTFERWESYGKQYKVPVSTLMDVISYGNSDDAKGEKNSKGKYIEGKSHQDKMRQYLNGIKGLSTAQKRGIWKIVVSDKGECPW